MSFPTAHTCSLPLYTRVHHLISRLSSFALSFVSFQSSRLSFQSHDHQAFTSSLFSFHRRYAYKSVPSTLARRPAVTAININVVVRRKNDFRRALLLDSFVELSPKWLYYFVTPDYSAEQNRSKGPDALKNSRALKRTRALKKNTRPKKPKQEHEQRRVPTSTV